MCHILYDPWSLVCPRLVAHLQFFGVFYRGRPPVSGIRCMKKKYTHMGFRTNLQALNQVKYILQHCKLLQHLVGCVRLWSGRVDHMTAQRAETHIFLCCCRWETTGLWIFIIMQILERGSLHISSVSDRHHASGCLCWIHQNGRLLCRPASISQCKQRCAHASVFL